MRTAFVLYIADNTVGPCLHLIRRVCNPESSSRPHVTVRYPIARLQENLTRYQNQTIDAVDIVEPGAFGLDAPSPTKTHTVFLGCDSDVLEEMCYKPYFTHSTFHITVYDGKNLEFAKQLLQVLERFTWGFTVTLPEQTRLTKIEIGGYKRNGGVEDQAYLDKLKSLFDTITSTELSTTLLTSLTDVHRLGLTEAICAHLHGLTAGFPRIEPRSDLAEERGRDDSLAITGQESDYYALKSSKQLLEDCELLKKKQLIYLTPPELAYDIVKYAVSRIDPEIEAVDFGDPAVGTGVFFSALLNVLPRDKIDSAIGIDIDSTRVKETRKRWSHRGLVVQAGDYLHMDKLPLRTLIIANPPYLRYQQIPKAYRLKLQERASVQVGMQVGGQSSLYVYFLLLSHGWMKREAVAAWLIPSEFMENNYGAVIRKYLTEKVELLRIHVFNPDKIQFENALVTSTVVVFRNCPPSPSQNVMLSSGSNLLKPEYIEQLTISDLINQDKWKVPWIRCREFSTFSPRIGDLFTVCRGLATGANDFFIMERSVAVQRGIPEVALRPILPKARALQADVIEREADGYPRVSPQLCLLDCNLSQEEIGIMYPGLLDYLKTAPERVLRSTLVRARKPWYRQEQRLPSPFLCTYMGRGSRSSVPLYFIRNKSDAVAANTYLMLYPCEELGRLVTEQPAVLEKVFDLLKEITSEDLLANSRVYGGGLYKVEPKELLNVRFLSFPTWLEEVVQENLI